MPSGLLQNTALLNKLFEVSRQLFDQYLASCASPEYQLRWTVHAEPAEEVPQLPGGGDVMSFTVSFDPDQEVVKMDVVFRVVRNAEDETAPVSRANGEPSQ